MLVRLICLAVLLLAPAAARADDAIGALEAVRRSIGQPHAPLARQWVEMDVCGSGEDRRHGFLNSQQDYRHPDSLNVELLPTVRARLAQRIGGDPVDVLLGRRIAVYGAVRQVRIDLYENGVRTEHFYFQTQMRLQSAQHLRLLEAEDGAPVPARCGSLVV